MGERRNLICQDDRGSVLSEDGIDEAISVVVCPSTEIMVKNQTQVIAFTLSE